MAPLTQRTTKSPPPPRRKKKPAYPIFQASRARSGWMLEDAMWRPNEPVQEDVSDLPGIDPLANAADHLAALGVMGSLIKPSLGISKMPGPIERSNVPSSAVSILDQ